MSTISASDITRLPPLPANVLHSIDFSSFTGKVNQTPSQRVAASSCTSLETPTPSLGESAQSRNKRILSDESVNPNPAKRRKVDCSDRDEIINVSETHKNGSCSAQMVPPPSALSNRVGDKNYPLSVQPSSANGNSSNPKHVQLDLSQADSDTIKAILSLAHHQQQQQQPQQAQPPPSSSSLQSILNPMAGTTVDFQQLLQSIPLSETHAAHSTNNILPIRNSDVRSLKNNQPSRESEHEREPMASLRNVALPNILVTPLSQHRQPQPQQPQAQPSSAQLEQAMQPLLDVRGLLQTVDDYGPKQINLYHLQVDEIDGLISTECTKSEIKKRIKEELLDIIGNIDKSLMDSEKRIQSLGTLKLIHGSSSSSSNTSTSTNTNSNSHAAPAPAPNVNSNGNNSNDPAPTTVSSSSTANGNCNRRSESASVPIPTPKFQNLPKFTLIAKQQPQQPQPKVASDVNVSTRTSHDTDQIKPTGDCGDTKPHGTRSKRMLCPLPNLSLSAYEAPKTPPYPQHVRDYNQDLTDTIHDTIARGQHHQVMDSKQQAFLCDALVQMSFEASLSPDHSSRSTTLEQPIENVHDALLAAKLMNLPPSNFNQMQLSSTNTMFNENEENDNEDNENESGESENHGVHIDPDVCLSMNLRTARSISALHSFVNTHSNNNSNNNNNQHNTLLAALSNTQHNQFLFCPPSFNETSSKVMPTLEVDKKFEYDAHTTSSTHHHHHQQNGNTM